MSDTPIKKQALLIGINQYQILSQLKYARQDAEAVADSLKQNYRFSEDEIMLLTDAKQGLFKPTNRYIIQEHLEKLANQELDLFIFGFWGHGLVRNGKRYLCPLDVMGSRAEYQGLPFDQVQELLAKIHAKNTCIILDCCQTVHDRGEAETLTVSDQTSMENAARDIVLRRKEQISNFQSNVAILNSCKEGQCAYEWDARKHGLFTAHLLDAMNKRSNSVMQITSYISSNIEKTALELGKEQTPFYKLEGDIVLPVETKSTPLVTGDVFISYRHCNADLVEPIEAELKRRKISYFIDRVGINYSMDYSTVIARAIRACKVLLVVWTKEANYSKDMLREVKMALDLNKSVVPYKIGTFNAIDHDALYFQLSPLSRCETAIQTPETISDVINQVEQALMRTPNPQPVIDAPDNLNDIVIQNPIAEGNSADDKPAQAEQSQPDPQNESSSSSWSSFKFEATITVFIGEETEVTIPDGVTEIGCGAFENCSSLKSVTIPDSVKTIKNAAFRNCSSLTSVTIPNHASIGVEAFAGCTSLKEWPDFSKNIYYRSDGAGLLNNNYLIACLASAKEYQVPERVTVIRDSAFSGCRFLTSVTLPKSVKKIEDGVFSDCSALTSIAIPDGVTVIGKSVFSGCKSLTSITLPDSLTKINVKAFSNCSSLESVKIPEGVTEIESNVFTGCSSLKSITFPGSLTKIGSYAFSACSSLTSITFPDSVTEIENNAFTGCSSLKSITFPGSLTKIGSNSFENCSSLESVIIPEGVTTINLRAFTGCTSLKSITFPDGLTKIGSNSFENCSSLESVIIPEGVAEIEEEAFKNCNSLISISLPSSLTTIEHRAFSGCSSLKSITIPDGVTEIEDGAFEDCSSLTSVKIPDSVEEIGGGAFAGCTALKEWSIPSTHPNFIRDGAGLLTKDGEMLISCLASAKNYRIPAGVSEIGDNAFENCRSLTSVEIPDGVSEIGRNTFKNCRSLTSVKIPKGVRYIRSNVFKNCTSLTSVTIPNSVVNISQTAFLGCTALKEWSISFANSSYARDGVALLTKNGERIVACLASAKKYQIPECVTEIGDYTFSGCSSLTSVEIPDSVTEIGENAFSGCRSLTSIAIPASVKKIGDSAFADCSSLTSVNIPEGITYIRNDAFSGCSSLKSVTISDGVAVIYNRTFKNCSSLTSVILPKSVTSIYSDAFDNCPKLTIYAPKGSYAQIFAREHKIPFQVK